MGKMYLMCGISGAGKTTFAKKFAEENGYIYLGIDDFYKDYQRIFAPNLKNPWGDPKISFKVWQEFFRVIHAYELGGYDVVIDTNAPTRVKRLQFIDWFSTFEEHNLIYIAADAETCIKNNQQRDRIVPEDEMKKMFSEFEEPVLVRGMYSNVSPWDMDERWDNIRVFFNESNQIREVPVIK